MSSALDDLQRRLGHRFQRPELLARALTHRSFGTPNYERLEFVGDGILGCVIAEALFATAIGLVAAIPAVIAYNKLTTNLGRTSQRMAFAIDDLATQMTRRTGRGLTAEAAE